MSLYTNIGTGLWTWEPFRRLERHHEDELGRCAKLFWIALYTLPEAKAVPGMFLGSVTTMAESARVPVDASRRYLDRLIEDDLVEYDIEHRVLRMTQLPDCGESPKNGNAIRGWWRRFNGMPACTVRDSHVTLLRWILDEWCRVNGKALSNDHAAAWSDTFGRVPIPAPRRKQHRHVQTDLFTASSSADPKINNLETNDRITTVIRERDQDQDRDQDLRSSEGARVLRLVPESPVPVDADDLAELLAQATGDKFPRALTKTQRQALQRAIESAAEHFTAPTALAVLGDYMKHGAPGLFPPRDSLTVEERATLATRGISPDLVASPGWLSVAIQKATEWAGKVAEQIAFAAASRKQLGHE